LSLNENGGSSSNPPVPALVHGEKHDHTSEMMVLPFSDKPFVIYGLASKTYLIAVTVVGAKCKVLSTIFPSWLLVQPPSRVCKSTPMQQPRMPWGVEDFLASWDADC
jgi:hypothetical protein